MIKYGFMDLIKPVLKILWNSSFGYFLRGLFFNFSEYLTDYRIEKKRFFEKMGYELDLKNPQSFSHYIVQKKIYDRDPILPILADKYAIRQYIRDLLGEEESQKILVPLLFQTKNPESIPFDNFEGEYILKANHNSGPNFIIEKDKKFDKFQIINQLKNQLKIPYGTLKHEWAYGKIKKRRVVVEKLLRDEDGKIPKDYKFHMVYGKCIFIQVDFDRFIAHSRTLYDKDWNYIPATLKFKQGPMAPRPKNLERMLSLAEKLSKKFDYIRVDLYDVGYNVFLGEMTHYPGSGMERFTPQDFDFEFGKFWKQYGK